MTAFSIGNIMKLLRLGVLLRALTYSEYGGKSYVLDCGPIGLSVIEEVAIISMEDFKMKTKADEHPQMNDWLSYSSANARERK